MALNFSRALMSKSLLTQIKGVNPGLLGARSVSIKLVAPAVLPEGHDEKNAVLGRPQSPHLTIYQPQLTTILSITHRGTGIALTGYAVILGVGALVLPHDFSYYLTMIEGLHLSAPSLIVAKYILAYPAAFHSVNGIRHLCWDMGKFLSIKEVYSTGYAMLAVSTVLAGVFAYL